MVVRVRVRSAANALAACCQYFQTRALEQQEAVILGIRKSDMLGTSTFYIATLTADQVQLGPALKSLQKKVGISVARFYTQYLRMVL